LDPTGRALHAAVVFSGNIERGGKRGRLFMQGGLTALAKTSMVRVRDCSNRGGKKREREREREGGRERRRERELGREGANERFDRFRIKHLHATNASY
jgi:hypothetical protein